jgi:hypothetical protein
MEKRLVVFSIILLGMISSTLTEICPTFKCGELEDHLCAKRTSNSTADLQSFQLANCTSKDEQCPFFNLESSDSLECQPIPSAQIKLYPGSNCKDDSDCILGNCNNSTCSGVSQDGECSSHNQCGFGYSCYLENKVNSTTKRCQLQKKEGESCTEDFDCVNTHGCFNSTCVRYFSLPDGHPVEYSPALYLSFCESGYEYNNACARLRLNTKDMTCSEDSNCEYTNYDGSLVILPNNCLCGYNPFGTKYCKLGSDHYHYKSYVRSIENLIKDNTHCNTEERGICNYNKKFPSKEFKLLNQQYINAKILGEFFHELVGADDCVVNVAYPEYIPDTPIPPTPTPNNTQITCGKFQCKAKQSNCTVSKFNINENNTMDVNVVFSDICGRQEYCDFGVAKNEAFYQGYDVVGTCKATSKPSIGVRYPGESCNADTDCFTADTKYNDTILGFCKNSVCTGYSNGDNCKETSWCNVGLFCDADSKCSPVRKENEACTKTTDCKNNLLCYKGLCQNVLYKLEDLTDVSAYGDDAYKYCKFGIANNGKCDSMNTTDTIDLKTGLVSCNPGQKCNYTTHFESSVTMECSCGYNSQGESFCPKGNNQNLDKWTDLYNARAKRFNNKCHSESREICYIQSNDANEINDLEYQTEYSHLFYGSPECARRVVNSSSFVGLSLLTAFILMIIF